LWVSARIDHFPWIIIFTPTIRFGTGQGLTSEETIEADYRAGASQAPNGSRSNHHDDVGALPARARRGAQPRQHLIDAQLFSTIQKTAAFARGQHGAWAKFSRGGAQKKSHRKLSIDGLDRIFYGALKADVSR
jgi:hypothetical protein